MINGQVRRDLGASPSVNLCRTDYSSTLMNSAPSKPGMGGVQAGIFLHLGGPSSSIFTASLAIKESFGSKFIACFFMYILHCRS